MASGHRAQKGSSVKALTIHQPWASLIVGAPPSYDADPTPPQKPLENRTWCPPASLVGYRIAIHAGKAIGGDVLESFYNVFKALAFGPVRTPYATPKQFPRGAVVGVATLDRVVLRWHGALVDAFTRDQWHPVEISDEARRWYTGDVGWVLRDVRYLREPVPCSGAQGLWTLPDDVERAVVEQLA